MSDVLKPARDPLRWSAPAELAEVFVPLGSRMRLETNSPRILEACRMSFGRYGSPPSSDHPRVQIAMRLLVDETFTEEPPWPDPIFRGQGDIFYVTVGKQNTAIAHLQNGFATGFVAPAMARDTVFLRNTFLDCLVLTMLTHGRAGTHTYAHASAVAWGNRGLIFSGPSQSGKTTLAFACARRGFNVVSDDVVYLRDGDAGLTVWGKPWHLRFLPDCTRFFPELKDAAAHLRFAGKDCVEVDVDEIFPGRTQTRCQPEAIFFLQRRPGPAAYEPLDPQGALELLARDLVQDKAEAIERHRRFWLALIHRGCYLLRFDEDLDAAVRLLERFLQQPASARGVS